MQRVLDDAQVATNGPVEPVEGGTDQTEENGWSRYRLNSSSPRGVRNAPLPPVPPVVRSTQE